MFKERVSIVLFGVMLFAILMFAGGCSTMNKAIESASKKNIATGSDTWGGEAIAEFFGEGWLPNITLTFGRTRQWYISSKDDNSTALLAEIVRASNSTVSAEVSKSGASFKNEAK